MADTEVCEAVTRAASLLALSSQDLVPILAGVLVLLLVALAARTAIRRRGHAAGGEDPR